MSIDPRIRQAIEEAVEEAQQNSSLADILIAWFGALATGNESLDDKESVARHLEALYTVTEVEKENSKQNEEDTWQQ